MIRQFSLINETGEAYNLMVREHFLNSPKGLGYQMEASYTKLGSSWIQNYFRDSQQPITGTVIITPPDQYLKADSFFRFIRKSKKIMLQYTTDAGTYIKDVDITQVDKTEITEAYTLQIGITFMPKSLWYSPVAETYVVTVEESNTMRYPFRFPARWKNYSNGIVTIENDGSTDAPFRAEVYGAIINPSIVLYQDNVELARLDTSVELSAGDMMYYSSVDGDLYCYAVVDGTETNLAPTLDLDNANFFKLPVGSSELRIEADTDILNPVVFTIYKQYRAV